MKAIVTKRYGPPERFHLQDVDKPAPKDNEVLVKVHASSLNAADFEIQRGSLIHRMQGLFRPKHKIPGSDVAGRIEAVDRNASEFQPGDEVVGDLFYAGFGAFAEYVCAPEHVLTLKPTAMTFDEAATLPQSAVIALQCLRGKREIQPGHKVLINSAGGGMGTFAVQLAKYFGAQVTWGCSTTNVELVKSLGADNVIDYTKEDFTESGETYDVIFDAVGKTSVSRCKSALNNKGIFLSVKSSGDEKEMTEELIFFKELIEAGKIKSVIDRRYPLEQIAEAHRYVEKGHKKGNVVITVEHNNKT